jgi:hypothetical protein
VKAESVPRGRISKAEDLTPEVLFTEFAELTGMPDVVRDAGIGLIGEVSGG